MFSEEPAQVGRVGETAVGRNLGNGQVGVVELHFYFCSELLVDQVLGSLSVGCGYRDLIEIARGDAELSGIECHLVLLCRMLVDEMHEAVEKELLARVRTCNGDVSFRNGGEYPHEHALHEIQSELLGKGGRRQAEEHLPHVHPEVYVLPALKAAGLSVVKQRELFHIVEVCGIKRDCSLKEESGGVKQHPYAEIGGSPDQLHDASTPENEFSGLMEVELLGTCGNDSFPPHADYLDAAVEMQRRGHKKVKVAFFIPDCPEGR